MIEYSLIVNTYNSLQIRVFLESISLMVGAVKVSMYQSMT